MTILSAEAQQRITEEANRRVDRTMEGVRAAMWGADGTRTPPGLRRLSTPQDRNLWMRFLARNASQEQAGMAAGSDIMSTAISHPAVQQAFRDEMQQPQAGP